MSAASHLERSLARLLNYGTWLASAAIAAGLALVVIYAPTEAAHSGEVSWMWLATAGIGLLILLPVMRVVLMLLFFLYRRDYRLALAAVLVLTIILAGVVLGLRTASGAAG